MQYNAQFKKFEPLEFNYDVCETILLWEQVHCDPFYPVIELYFQDESVLNTDMLSMLQYRNMTTVLTREYLDARPDGWLDYAPQRIAQLYGSHYHASPVCSFINDIIVL